METAAQPFPLAVNSAHHSHYHRFLLGAEASILAPLPKPYCVGSLGGHVAGLAVGLDLPRWRKLYNGSFPWAGGFARSHYEMGNVPPYRPLPAEYLRPARRYAAFDFVQFADPSVSALALVSGDRRVISRFLELNDDYCRRIETGVCAAGPGSSQSRATGRMLAGQFAEPNSRWLMPMLHVHSRVLNLTAHAENPGRLECLDGPALSRAGQREGKGWLGQQAAMLSELGYRVAGALDPVGGLRVEGVGPKLLAAIEAPRIAVLRILEKTMLGAASDGARNLVSELPPAVVAAMAEQLEVLLARAAHYHRPMKMGIPSEGPWRRAVREHLGHCCPAALDAVDREARRAKAEPISESLFASPSIDAAHLHGTQIDQVEATVQQPSDPELGTSSHLSPASAQAAPRQMIDQFRRALVCVNESIVRAATSDPLTSLRGPLAKVDRREEEIGAAQIKRAGEMLWAEIRGIPRDEAPGESEVRAAGMRSRLPVSPLDGIFEFAAIPRTVCEPEIGGRSL